MSPNHPTSEANIFYEDWAEDGYYDDDYEDELAWWHGYGGYDNEKNYWDDYDLYYDDYDDGHYYWDDVYGWVEEPLDGEAQQPDAAEDDPSRQSEDPHQADAQGDYYKGKSKGKGGEDGCFNCGSKWHMVKDCPLQAQRHGDQRGKGKGYGKPFGMRKGKSKGKGKSWGYRPFFKGKGKGRSKGSGKSSYGRKGYGKRHWFATPKPTLDFSAGIPDASTRKSTSLSSSSHVMTNDNTKVEKFIMHTSSEEEDFTGLKRSTRSSKSPDNAETATVIPEKKHGTAFSFAVFHADRHAKETESYFTVRGEQRHGLLVDPGAASGLIGSETLRELMSRCVTPLGKNDEVVMDGNKTTPVSGINGGSNHTLGEVTLPLQAGGQNITFTAEVIGGDGSMCPDLVGNPTVRKMDSSIFSNWFANGDGLLMVGGRNAEENSKEYRLFRLLLTESYILPTDYESSGKVARETRKEIILFSQRVADESLQRWNDVHTRVPHCFMSKDDTAEQTEGDLG